MEELAPYRDLPGAGAGGGLGAALAWLGGELKEGAEVVLQLTRFDERARGAAFAVTGEGTVDETTLEGKAPGAVLRHCRNLGVPCVALRRPRRRRTSASRRAPLSGDPSRAREDLVALGEELARARADGSRTRGRSRAPPGERPARSRLRSELSEI